MSETHGRPTKFNALQRRRELLRLLAAGHDPKTAARLAKVKPDTVLGYLADPQFRAAFTAILDQPRAVAA